MPELEERRNAPGEEVDQGGQRGALKAEDLAGAAVSGAPSDRPGRTVTDSHRSGTPDTARKAA
jgi:hypothetical protein